MSAATAMGIATNTHSGDRNEQIAEIRVSDESVLTMPYGSGVKDREL